MPDKPTYRLTIKLTSARTDALNEALTYLRELTAERDAESESTATITIESYKEAPIQEIMDGLETWLYHYQIGIAAEMNLKRTGLRPETIATLRALYATPMDKTGWESAPNAGDEPAANAEDAALGEDEEPEEGEGDADRN